MKYWNPADIPTILATCQGPCLNRAENPPSAVSSLAANGSWASLNRRLRSPLSVMAGWRCWWESRAQARPVLPRRWPHAETRGAQVLWRRCYEEEGAPPYWPWVQAIRSYVQQREGEQLQSEMGLGAADIAEIVPEIRLKLSGLETPLPLDTPLLCQFIHDGTAQHLTLRIGRLESGATFREIPGSRVRIDTGALDPTFLVDVVGIAAYFEGFASLRASVDYDLLYFGDLPSPIVFGSRRVPRPESADVAGPAQ